MKLNYLVVELIISFYFGHLASSFSLRFHPEQHVTASSSDSTRKQSKDTNDQLFLRDQDNDDKDPTRYFKQILNHFNPYDERTFKQRYFIRDEFFKPNSRSPVFLCVGGEGPPLDKSVVYEDDANVHCALMVQYAKEVGALILALEHRYYGESVPTKDLSNENLEWLSSEQALRDLVYFHDFISTNYNLDPVKNKWISWGGSYPGMMASFARVKYPHLIHGTVSSSAPVQSILNFRGYNKFVKSSMESTYVGGSRKFASAVTSAFAELGRKLVANKFDEVKKLFGLCDSVDLQKISNQQGLVEYAMNIFPLQENDPSCPGTDCNYRKLSSAFASGEGRNSRDPLQNLAAIFIQKYANSSDCLGIDGDAGIEHLKDVSASNVDRVWIYQTCTEWGFYQTCESSEICPFFTRVEIFSLQSFLKICEIYDLPGSREPSWHEKRINMTNSEFGGNLISRKNSHLGNILYVNGEVDPWRASSVEHSQNPGVGVLFVAGASHHFWTHNAKETDDIAVRVVRKKIKYIVHGWLAQWAYDFDNQSQFPLLSVSS